MGEIFHDKIRFKAVVFEKAQELAAYNFKFKSSVEYLDLAINENLLHEIHPSSFKSVFRFEDIENRIVPERQILYRLHLDLPKVLRSFSCKNKTEYVTEGFHIQNIFCFSSIYNNGLERCIVAAIENDKRKIEKLRSYLKILEILNFGRNRSVFLCDSVLSMLYRENCSDSELLRKFLRLSHFPLWLCVREIPKVLEYVLLQAQRGRFLKELLGHLDQQIDFVDLCLINHKIENMLLLIKYGTVAINPSESDLYTTILRNYDLGPASYPRACRLLQLMYDFHFHRHSPEGMRSMWQSIKDPFLSSAEIDSFLQPMFSPFEIESRIKYYEDKIIQQGCRFGPTPRSLKDLCRVDIRKFLSDSHQIPFGISHFVIPESLKLYLNLEGNLPFRASCLDLGVSNQ